MRYERLVLQKRQKALRESLKNKRHYIRTVNSFFIDRRLSMSFVRPSAGQQYARALCTQAQVFTLRA